MVTSRSRDAVYVVMWKFVEAVEADVMKKLVEVRGSCGSTRDEEALTRRRARGSADYNYYYDYYYYYYYYYYFYDYDYDYDY